MAFGTIHFPVTLVVGAFHGDTAMATVSFSVPDDVKADFHETFGGQYKSAVIAGLMRKAIAERKSIADEKQRERREAIFRTLMHRRAKRPSMRATR
jgi:hypothetical protein